MDPFAVAARKIDSIINLFRQDFSGRGELSERQQKLNQMLSRLTKVGRRRPCFALGHNRLTGAPSPDR